MINMDYVLITPARNEEANIGRLIEAVLSQKAPPKRWVVVSDGSTDGTDAIVFNATKTHSFIQLVRAAEHTGQDFSSKAKAFLAGYEQIRDLEFGFIGNLDADVTFGPDYFERLLEKFQVSTNLGLAGGLIHERAGGKFEAQIIASGSVAGAVQLFRRECFEAIGGYIPIRGGGIDAAAEIMARMHGYGVQTIRELPVQHHRRVSTGSASGLSFRFQQGVTNYLLGYHPLFHLISCISRIFNRPCIIGSVMAVCGYTSARMRGEKQVLPAEVVRYLRAEQMIRIASLLGLGKRAKRAAFGVRDSGDSRQIASR